VAPKPQAPCLAAWNESLIGRISVAGEENDHGQVLEYIAEVGDCDVIPFEDDESASSL
jgi:hypothetical protein